MTPETNRQVVERFVKALVAHDLDLQAEVCAPDIVTEYPQSGERLRGWANVRAMAENYPGGLPKEVDGKVIGSADKWVVGPSCNILRIERTGDVYTLVASVSYPDRQTWQLMSALDLRAGKIARTRELAGAQVAPPHGLGRAREGAGAGCAGGRHRGGAQGWGPGGRRGAVRAMRSS